MVRFDNKIYKDSVQLSRIGYLKPINKPPTDAVVVRHTLELCLKIREELGQEYIEVTYDLAVAKLALRIQSVYSPLYDSVFIHLGFFHVQMAFFHAVGTFIDDSGFSTIMIQSGLIASDSVSGFMLGKHFNRNKRLHPIMYVALQILLWEKFIDRSKTSISESLKIFARIPKASL